MSIYILDDRHTDKKWHLRIVHTFIYHCVYTPIYKQTGGSRVRTVVGFTTTFAISAYHHLSCEFESCSWRGVLDTTLCDKVCQLLVAGLWFSPGTQISSTAKTDRHDITEILLKVVLNTINPNPNPFRFLHTDL